MNDHCKVITDDGAEIRLGDVVWCNHMAGRGPGPVECRLIGVGMKDDGDLRWPWEIEYGDRNGDGTVTKQKLKWSHIYSTRDKAIAADPWPEIERLRGRIRKLEDRVRELEAPDLR